MNSEFENIILQAVNFAEAVSTYFNTLVQSGMSREEALAITINWQNSIIAKIPDTPQEGKK